MAVREKLFKILIKAHKQCQHGGRDKTSAQVRRVYSWFERQPSDSSRVLLTVAPRVPKELISRFVKSCPTCQVRRGTSRNSPPESEKSPEARMEAQSPATTSGNNSRKNSVANRQPSMSMNLPLQTAGFASSSIFQQQNRWMTPLQPQQAETHRINRSSSGSNLSTHDSYNTMPPIPMSCTNATPPGLAYSTVSTIGSDTAPSSAYSSDSLTQATHGHVSADNNYLVKAEHHYM